MDIINLKGRVAMTGAALSVSAYNSIRQYKDISGGAVTLTDELLDGDMLYLRLDGAGPVTFPDGTLFPGGSAPALDSSGTTFLRFEKQGTVLYGFSESVVPGTGGTGGGLSPFWATAPTPPTLSDFKTPVFGPTVGSHTLAEKANGVAFSVTQNADGDAIGLLPLSAAPGSTWTFVTLLSMSGQWVSYNQAGIFIRNTSSGKFIDIARRGPDQCYTGERWNSLSTYREPMFFAFGFANPILWFKAQSNGTTITMSCSVDGYSWIPIKEETISYHLASVDEVGIYINPNKLSVPNCVVGVTVLNATLT